MRELFDLLKTPIYRILFNFPIGVIAFVILNYIFNNDNNNVILTLQLPIHYSDPALKNIYWLIYITSAILIGEIVSFIGEIPVNVLFGYDPTCPIDNGEIRRHRLSNIVNHPMELITPSHNEKIFYSDLAHSNGISSEIHFSISRMLAGFGFEMYLVASFLNTNTSKVLFVSRSILLVLILALIFQLIFPLLYSILCKFKKIQSKVLSIKRTIDKCLSICILIGALILVFVLIYYSKRTSAFDTLCFSVSFSSYIASIFYRAHANKLTAASRR